MMGESATTERVRSTAGAPSSPGGDSVGQPRTEDTSVREGPSVFDISLPEVTPLLRLQIGERTVEVSFWSVLDLCRVFDAEYREKEWEEFSPIVAATLGVESFDQRQWEVLLKNVEVLLQTSLKKNFQIMKEVEDLHKKSLGISSD